MKDRRPENDELREVIEQHDEGVAGTHQYAEIVPIARMWLNDPVSLIRRGVESGTISGMEVVCDWCDGEGTNGFDRNGSHAAGEYREFTCTQCDGSGRILIIPVSDGGSET